MSRYLSLYNLLSFSLWLAILVRLCILYYLVGPEFVSEGMAEFVSWVQALAVLEVVHVIFGLVKSSVITTAMQVASRLAIIWGVVRLFPASGASVAFSTMVLAWAITECIRYPYYFFALQGRVPPILEWIRYTAFIALYPLGAISEAWLAYRALPAAQFWHPYYALFLKVLLLIYPPSFYVLYMHMWKQRRKVFGRKLKRN